LTHPFFKKLYDECFDPLRTYLFYRSGDEALATDICQDVFLRVWKRKPDLSWDQLRGLLYKMAKDQYVDWLRKEQVGQAHLETLSFRWNNQDPQAQLELNELKLRYEASLAQLPEHQRTVYLMNRKDGLTYKEIAQRLNLSIKTIEKRMRVALQTLKKQLQDGTA